MQSIISIYFYYTKSFLLQKIVNNICIVQDSDSKHNNKDTKQKLRTSTKIPDESPQSISSTEQVHVIKYRSEVFNKNLSIDKSPRTNKRNNKSPILSSKITDESTELILYSNEIG